MKRRVLAAVALVCAMTALAVVVRSQSQSAAYDIVIRGGHIVDGTGNPWFAGDVAIAGGRIVGVGRLRNANARRVVDASGMIVAPGFIDLHTHSDMPLLEDGTDGVKRRGHGVSQERHRHESDANPPITAGHFCLLLPTTTTVR